MTDQQKHIAYLWRQFAGRQITPVELDELFGLLQTEEHSAFSSSLLEELYAAPAEGEWDREYWLGKLEEIKKAPAVTGLPAAPVRKMRPWRWVAAASVIFIMAIAVYFYLNQKTATNPEEHTKLAADIKAPSSNRAKITLASGQVIYLDSIENGTIAKQDNTELKKLEEGKIIYSAQKLTTHDSLLTFNTLTNPRGSKVIDITLSDGSRVWLNAESSLKYPVAFSGNERKVEITGEAYFEVIHNTKQPFKVTKGSTEIQVLGTHFNVNAYSDEGAIKVTLLEGSVKLSELTTHDSRLIKPGEQVVVAGNGQLTTDNSIDIEQVMAWKNGKFDFGEGRDLKDIMRQVSRWYDVDVEYSGDMKESFGGSISRQVNISAILQKFELTGRVHFKLDGKKLTVTP